MTNVIMSAGNGGYIAGIVIELLIIIAAGVFIFLTLTGKLNKLMKKEEVADEGVWGDEAPTPEEAEEEEVAEEEPLMAEEAPLPEKKSKKAKKEVIEEEAEEAAEEADEAEPEVTEVRAPKGPTKRKIKIRLNIKSTDGSEILSTDVSPTETGDGETEEAKIDVNVDEISKAIEVNGESEANADAATEAEAEVTENAEEPVEEEVQEEAEEPVKGKKWKRGRK